MATTRKKFTNGVIEEESCDQGKSASFIWDTEAPGLGLRISKGGAKTYVFQGKVKKTRTVVRIRIGDVKTYTFDDARKEARRLRVLLDEGKDPRQVATELIEAAQAAQVAKAVAKAALEATERSKTITFAEIWTIYLEDRKPFWGDRHYRDHIKKIAPGGIKSQRGTRGLGITIAGPLNHFAGMPLININDAVVTAWAKREAAKRPTSARLAWRMLKVFFQWCLEEKQYVGLVPDGNPGKTKKTKETFGRADVKTDNLLSAQLPIWFDSIKKIGNPTVSAYLQVLLLTGARPGEILIIKWDEINWRWASLQIRDKIDGTRTIPLTPYVAHLIAALPRRLDNEYVFSSAQNGVKIIGKPHQAHKNACNAAGLQGLTLHGLRRSFASLTAQMAIAGGAAMQIQGHKPTSVREKSYIHWPLEFLQKTHNQIEAEILALAGIKFVPVDTKLRVITNP